MLKRLVFLFTFVLLTAPLIVAQGNLRLQFELYKNGALIGKPLITVNEGGKGSISLPEFVDVSFTASRIAENRTTIAFEITAAGKTIRPRIILFNEEEGSLSWTPASDSLELRVAASSK